MYGFMDKLWAELEKLKLEKEVDKNTDIENEVSRKS
jgi:hypothetical protein